ncbi:hypothetical protein G3N57_12920 [Paraburkholderia sp. Se-20369]|nr:hypothetical protein [Paraburkholderia sp. Se-20369]
MIRALRHLLAPLLEPAGRSPRQRQSSAVPQQRERRIHARDDCHISSTKTPIDT